MKNILVWGTGGRYCMYRSLLLNYCNICALVNNDPKPPKTLDNIPVISKNEITSFQFDVVVIAVQSAHTAQEIRQEAAQAGIPDEKILSLDQFLSRYDLTDIQEQKQVREKQLRVLQSILEADDRDVQNYSWWYNKICEYGIYCFRPDWYKLSETIQWTVYGLMQIPEEFAEFCLRLSALDIKTAIEIGVYKGKSSYFMCAVLMRRNPSLSYKLVDIRDQLDDFEEFHKILPALQKCIPSTSDEDMGQSFDFVFIDGDHSYDGAMRDFHNLGVNSRVITAFHDVYAHEYDKENGGVVRAWQEVLAKTQEQRHAIYSMYPEKWMGIGCILR